MEGARCAVAVGRSEAARTTLFPHARLLGLKVDEDLPPTLVEKLTYLATKLPSFRDAHETLDKLLRKKISPRRVERQTERIGAERRRPPGEPPIHKTGITIRPKTRKERVNQRLTCPLPACRLSSTHRAYSHDDQMMNNTVTCYPLCSSFFSSELELVSVMPVMPCVSGMVRLSSFALSCLMLIVLCDESISAETPNIVVIFTDDQGYGDLGCYGGQHVKTPHLDQMATEGMRFTDFYVAQAVCGASRAALLTGCYPNRLGMLGAPGPKSTHGIHDRETLLSELLRSKGYATAAIGKWHLGHHVQYLPTRHGFDTYFGLPYSNDMWPYHPEAGARFPDLPLIEGDRAINPKVTSEDQTMLTRWYTEHAIDFIQANRETPFFLYLAHNMPHVPLHTSPEFQGRTGLGMYADVIAEIDDSVGQVISTIRECGVEKHTLVVFATDNGPWLSYGNHAGSAGPLREGKGTTFEGGMRVPCVMKWPGRIPAGAVCRQLAATIDLVPTIAGLVQADLPAQTIDGCDIWPLMSGWPDGKTPHESYLYYWGNELQAIRSGPWKLHFPHAYRSLAGKPGQNGKPNGYREDKIDLSLFNLHHDIGETTDVKSQHPDVVEQLQQLAEQARVELGDSAQKRTGAGYRAPGQVK